MAGRPPLHYPYPAECHLEPHARVRSSSVRAFPRFSASTEHKRRLYEVQVGTYAKGDTNGEPCRTGALLPTTYLSSTSASPGLPLGPVCRPPKTTHHASVIIHPLTDSGIGRRHLEGGRHGSAFFFGETWGQHVDLGLLTFSRIPR